MHSRNRILNQPTILIVDSGVGGLSIYEEVKNLIPNANYIYVFDNNGFPYGEKPACLITDFVIGIVSSITRKYNLDLIIIACNTASTILLPTIRKLYLCPIIGVVPAIKPAVKLTKNRIIGLLATKATIRRQYTLDLISKFALNCQILSLGSSELTNIAEAKLHGKIVSLSILRKILKPWLCKLEPPDTIVLGCTHFPLLSQELYDIFPKGTNFVDSGKAIARRAVCLIGQHTETSVLYRTKKNNNKAYYLADSSKITYLIPALRKYGFLSLEQLFI